MQSAAFAQESISCYVGEAALQVSQAPAFLLATFFEKICSVGQACSSPTRPCVPWNPHLPVKP